MIDFELLIKFYNIISQIKLNSKIKILTNENVEVIYKCVWDDDFKCYALLDIDSDTDEWNDAETFRELMNDLLIDVIKGRIQDITIII